MKLHYLAFAAVAASLAASAGAQEANEAIIYGKGHFKGPGLTLSGPTRPIDPPYQVRSIQIPQGQSWEFCTGRTYTGCKEFNASDPSVVLNVRSARPVAPVLTETAVNAAIAAGGQASLRGYSSEFFIVPGDGGNRIEVAGGTSEARSRAAQDFCRGKGWRAAPYARLQNIDGRHFLADVLCADSD